MAVVQLDLHLFHTDARKFSLFYFDPDKERTIQDVLEKICSMFEIHSTYGTISNCDEVAVMCEGFYLHPSLPSSVILNCTSSLLLFPVKVTVLSSSSKDYIKTRIDVVHVASEDENAESNGTADFGESITQEQHPTATQTKAEQCSLVSGISLKAGKKVFTSNEICNSSCKEALLLLSSKKKTKLFKRKTELFDAAVKKTIQDAEQNHAILSDFKNSKLKSKSLSSDASCNVFHNATLISAPSISSGSPATHFTSLCSTSPISVATPITDACPIASLASISTIVSPSPIASSVTGAFVHVETHDPFVHPDDFSSSKMTTNESNKYSSEEEVSFKMNLSSVSSPKTSAKVKPKRRRKHNKRLKKEKKKLQEIFLANCASTVLTATENNEEKHIQNVDHLSMKSKKEYIKVRVIDPNKFKKEKCSIIPFEGKKIVFNNPIAVCEDHVTDAPLCDSQLLITDTQEMVSNGAKNKCFSSANIIEREQTNCNVYRDGSSDVNDESNLCQTAKKDCKETLKYFIASRLQKTLEKHSDVPDDNKGESEEFTIPVSVSLQGGPGSTPQNSNKEKKLCHELKEDSSSLVKRSTFNQSTVLSTVDAQVNGRDQTENSESMLCYDKLPNHSMPAIVCEDNFKMLIELQKSNGVAVFKYDRSSMQNTRNGRKDKSSGSVEIKPLSQSLSDRSHENILRDKNSISEGNSVGWFPFRTPPNPTPFSPPSIEMKSRFFFLSSIEDPLEPLMYYRHNAYGDKKKNNKDRVDSASCVTLPNNGLYKTVYNNNEDQMSLNDKAALNHSIGTSYITESCIREGETISIPTVADEPNGKDKCLNILCDKNSLISHIPKLNNSYQSAIDKNTALGELTQAEDTSHNNSKLIDGANIIPFFIGAAARKNKSSGVKRPRAMGIGDVLQRLRNENSINNGVSSESKAEHGVNSCKASFANSVSYCTKYNGFINQSEGESENDCKKLSMKCVVTEKSVISTGTTSAMEDVVNKKRQRGKRVRSRPRSSAVGSPHSEIDNCNDNYKRNSDPSNSDNQLKRQTSTTYWDMTPEEYLNRNEALKVSSCSTVITNTEETQVKDNTGHLANLSSTTIASLPLLTTEPRIGDIVLFYHAGNYIRDADVSNAVYRDDYNLRISRRKYDDGNCNNFKQKHNGGRNNSSNSYEDNQINTKDEEITTHSRSHHKLKSNIKLESKAATEEEAPASPPRLLGRVTAMRDGVVSLQLVERSVDSKSCAQLVDLTGPDDMDGATLTLPWSEALQARLVFP